MKNITLKVNEQLGMRIRYLRKNKGLSIEDLALDADINRNYLSDLERGRRNPTLLILEAIANSLDVDLSELFKGIKTID